MVATMTTPVDTSDRVRFMARLDPDLHAGLSAAAEEMDWSTNSALNEAVRDWLQRREANRSRVDRPDGPNIVDLVPMTEPGRLRVLVDGYPVPHLSAWKSPNPSTGDAFGLAVLELNAGTGQTFQSKGMRWAEFWPTAWFLANAMAVAAGYSSHGPDATRLNPHGPNEAVDIAAWAEHGWTVEGASGRRGKGYELTVAFALPYMDDGDLQAYSLREEVVRFLAETGARDLSTRIIALGAMQAEPTTEPVASQP
jgi:hypothetical protein